MNNKIEFKTTPDYEMVGEDLVLLEDTIFEKNLIVKGNITCENGRYSLFVDGDIIAKNIDVYDIEAYDIEANDIIARNIFCETRIKKTPDAKTIAVALIENRSGLELKEQMPMEEKK